MAGSSITLTEHRLRGRIRYLHYSLVGDDASGAFPTIVLPDGINGYLLMIQTDPGATAPTDNWDVTLIDGEGFDRLQTVGTNRDTANSEEAPIVFSATALHPPVAYGETLTLTTAGNSVNDAIVEIFLYYEQA